MAQPTLEKLLLEILMAAVMAAAVVAVYATQGFRKIWLRSDVATNTLYLLLEGVTAYAAARAACVLSSKARSAAVDAPPSRRLALATAVAVPALAITAAAVLYVARLPVWWAAARHPTARWLGQNVRERGAADAAYVARLMALLVVCQLGAATVLRVVRVVRWQASALVVLVWGGGDDSGGAAAEEGELPLSPAKEHQEGRGDAAGKLAAEGRGQPLSPAEGDAAAAGGQAVVRQQANGDS